MCKEALESREAVRAVRLLRDTLWKSSLEGERDVRSFRSNEQVKGVFWSKPKHLMYIRSSGAVELLRSKGEL